MTKCLQVNVSSTSSNRCVCSWELISSFMSIKENRRLWRFTGRLIVMLIWLLFEGIGADCKGSISVNFREVNEVPALNFHGNVNEAPAVYPELVKLGNAGFFSRLLEYALEEP